MNTMDLDRTASTVGDLADHMDRMRKRTVELHDALDTGSRGFFTPMEDELVLGLWVSYHKSRGALLELIDTIRKAVGEPSQHVISEFTIAYAAALVLVDAARFLRDLFAEDELVRRKLNESHLNYGIQAGSFDQIQMSLTDPFNALKLRDATLFHDQYSEIIREAARATPELNKLIDVIDTRIDAVRVATARYLKVRFDERRHQLNESVMQNGLMKALYAFQQWGSRAVSSLTTMPGHVPRLPDEIAKELHAMIRPGDVFVTRKEGAVTNYFLPGYWPHAALYAGSDSVIESLKDGVRVRPLDSPFGNDAVTLIRPKLDEDLIREGLRRAQSHVGKPYDFDFDFTRSDRLVCTEVVYRSFSGIGGIEFQLKRRAGRQTLSAEDLLNLALTGSNFDLVAVFCRRCGDKLLTERPAAEALRTTMAGSKSSPA